MSLRLSAAAPPAVAARSASMGVSPISRTASAMTNGIELEKHVPGYSRSRSATGRRRRPVRAQSG